MKSGKIYKPILVLYLKDFEKSSLDKKENVINQVSALSEEVVMGVIILSTEGENRAEIISVEKATVVEDIKKYIDLKLNK